MTAFMLYHVHFRAVPAPRKPIPLTTCAAILSGSALVNLYERNKPKERLNDTIIFLMKTGQMAG